MKTMTDYRGNPVTVYQEADLIAILPILQAASELWRLHIKAYVAEHGDRGSCVLGAGITIPYLPKGCKKYRSKLVIPPPTMAQGSCCWESSKDEILEFLASRGVQAGYRYGNMD